jgi:hypothetical protein
MQMLGAGGMPLLTDGARAADVDNPRGYFELEAAKRTRDDASWVTRAAGRAVKLVHLLVPALPDGPRYRVVLVRRRLVEVLASQRAMLARRGASDDGLSDSRLAAVFSAQLDEVVRWAERRPQAALLEVDYAAAVARPGLAAAALGRFLPADLDEAAMAAAVDPSLWRQRAATRDVLAG